MAAVIASRVAKAFACLAAAAILLAGCGSSGSDNGTSSESGNLPAPPKSDFPSAKGKTLADVLNSTSGPAKLVVSPTQEVFYKGENRYAFGVFQLDHSQVSDAQVALYFARVPPSEATTLPPNAGQVGKSSPSPAGGAQPSPPKESVAQALDQPAVGPFPAAVETLATEPAFRAQTTANDPDAATAVYVTHINFPKDGEWRIAAVIKKGDELTTTLMPSAVVGAVHGIPRVGQRPPRIHTLTPEDVGGDLSKLTTRIPPETMNKVDFFDALGRKPIVLLFATPQFCQSRVCGPVVDIAEQVQEQYGDKADFIHMEIYNDNDPSKGVRPQVRAFNLPSEPWLFVIDRRGVIRTVIEGAFNITELEDAVKGVTG
jgi:hypothetical protein